MKAHAPCLYLPAKLLEAEPHLPAFWPEYQVLPWQGGQPNGQLALPEDTPAPAGMGVVRRFTYGPWGVVRFAERLPPLTIIEGASPDPIASALSRPASAAALARAPDIIARLAAARLGGRSGLPDPGGTSLGLVIRSTALVLDPCDPARRATAEEARQRAEACGLPVRVFRDPFAPDDAASLWHESAGPFDPWSLLDGAAALFAASRPMALLAMAAGVRCADGPLADSDPVAVFARLITATRAADPFKRSPCDLSEAIDLLALWRAREAENRRFVACLGIQTWKQERIGKLLASSRSGPEFFKHPQKAITAAKSHSGALLVWASSAKPALKPEARRANVALAFLEDGFLRSAGIGAAFRPGGSFILDQTGPYYDPTIATDLEAMLNTFVFSPLLLKRAAALRQTILAQGLTKYNLAGGEPTITAPAGRRLILVPGQVEDDAAVIHGGGAIRSNLALLRAVRAAEPDAFLIYKPHPDIEAGFRQGRIPKRKVDGLADLVVTQTPITALFAIVDAVHCLTSLAGFEALLRGRPVTVWGQPFYAGWGLTEDRGPAFPAHRRRHSLDLDMLVAATLILYPRYIDPVTELPCPVEVFLERLSQPELWPLGRWAGLRAMQGWARRHIAQLLGRA